MTLTEILPIIGIAGVTSVIFSFVFRWVEEWRSNRKHARFLALRVSVLMDTYFHECLDGFDEIKNYKSSRGHVGALRSNVPESPKLPNDDIGWLHLERNLADRVLRVSPNTHYRNSKICFLNSVNELDQEGIGAILKEAANESYDLSVDIRSHYKLEEISNSREAYNKLNGKED